MWYNTCACKHHLYNTHPQHTHTLTHVQKWHKLMTLHTQISPTCILPVAVDGRTLSAKEASPYEEPGVWTWASTYTSNMHKIVY